MNSRKRSGSGIFLMEMIMVCGFFLLCAAVCIQVFMRSDAMSRLAREKNQAVLAAESLAAPPGFFFFLYGSWHPNA